MKVKITILAVTLTLITSSQPSTLARKPALTPSLLLLPDLVVTQVTSPDLDGGQVWVEVMNKGQAPAGACTLHLKVAGINIYNMAQKSLAPQAKTTVKFLTKKGGLSQMKYEVKTDWVAGTPAGKIKESNESNNVFTGQFSGKP